MACAGDACDVFGHDDQLDRQPRGRWAKVDRRQTTSTVLRGGRGCVCWPALGNRMVRPAYLFTGLATDSNPTQLSGAQGGRNLLCESAKARLKWSQSCFRPRLSSRRHK